MNRRAFFSVLPAGLLTFFGVGPSDASVRDDGIVYLSAPRTRFRVKQSWEDYQKERQRTFAAERHPCPICGQPLLWVEARIADDTSPTSTTRVHRALGNIYHHADGTRCHRYFYTLAPVKGVGYRS